MKLPGFTSRNVYINAQIDHPPAHTLPLLGRVCGNPFLSLRVTEGSAAISSLFAAL